MKEYHRAIVEASSEEEKKKAEYRMYKVITDRLEYELKDLRKK